MFYFKYSDVMKIKNIIGVLILILYISGCKAKTDEFEFEKKVLIQILPSLVDSICVDRRLVIPPPFLGGFVTDEKGDVFVDSTQITVEQKGKYAEWEKLREKAKQDTSSVFIAFNPLVRSGYGVFVEEKDTIKSFLLDFNKIKLNNKFKLKNISEFPNTGRYNDLLFQLKYDFVFSGIFAVSGIKFDSQKREGVLAASFDHCGRCGVGYDVYIKNINGIWLIKKLQINWQS